MPRWLNLGIALTLGGGLFFAATVRFGVWHPLWTLCVVTIFLFLRYVYPKFVKSEQ